MPLESPIPTSIPNLNPLWPNGALGDTVNQGDNAIRYIKNALVTQLGSLGTGALTVTAAQLNAAAASAGQVSTGTSTTSLLIGLGSKSFTTQAGRGFAVGQRVRLVSTANVANLMEGIVTAYDFATGAMTVNVDTTGGSGTYADWSVFVIVDVQLPSVTRFAKTGAYTIVGGDRSDFIDMTGSWTLSFDACSALQNGFYVYLRNSGTGEIVLDPSGTETIDGLTSFIMYPNEVRLVSCDGTALRSFVIQPFYVTYIANAVFTKPPGYALIGGVAWGGGGGGGKSGSASNASGGGGGACAHWVYPASSVGTTENVVIGSGGASTAVSGPGGSGGSTTFGALILVYGGGGGGGNSGAAHSGGGGGGALSAGTVGGATAVLGGGPVINDTTASFKSNPGFGGGGGALNDGGSSAFGGGGGGGTSTGGASVWGGGGGGGADNGGGTPTVGGASRYAGGGGSGGNATVGIAGTAPAGGGGGTKTGANSGAGGRGELRIWGIA